LRALTPSAALRQRECPRSMMFEYRSTHLVAAVAWITLAYGSQ
jgi:hypothetical protein